ncbi:hypothetical protein [Streptomyces sp. NPDC053048]|uniref:hypothetical protein n=1 Tax=Streptomyces sp. NPDC053048 TaxID=3365694 RepID=UPI0037D87EAC
MGERFSTTEQVREHWLSGGDTYRISETKAEADQRRAAARSRADRAHDEELVGEALVIARAQRTQLPTADQYRWGVFHTGTALPVAMMESGQDADQARALAEAIDAWRDAESGQPFDWDSDGLSDRLRSPYGRGMLDQARGREPGERWAASPLAETQTYETDDGQAYTYAKVDRELHVFAPGGLLIARAASRFDANTRKDAWIGEMRDGRRLAGRWESHFVEHAVQQHLIAQQDPADRDDLWIHYTADRAMVHGSDRYDADLKKVMRSAGFTWSGYAKAYVTAGTTRPVARAQSVDRLARALYEEGRAVEIRADEDRLRGIHAPAAPGTAAAAAKPVPAPTAAAQAPEPKPVLAPTDLTDDQLAAELSRLTRERDAAVYGGTRRRRLDEQLAPLTEENRRRIVVSYQERADPAGMTVDEIIAERQALAESLRGDHGNHPVKVARQERADLLAAEHGRRLAAELEARPPVLQMTDEDLRAEGEILAKGRYGTHPGAAREAFDVRREAVGVEIADRHLRTWEPEQAPVGELDDIELTEAIEALRSERLYDTAFAGHYASRQRIEQVHGARLEALRDEQKKRDTAAFEALLKSDGRIRLESRSYTAGVREDDVRVFIDGRRYADLTEAYPGWKVSILLGRGAQNNTAWRTEALSWLIEQYEASPQTRDTRTWGPVAEVELPPAFVSRAVEEFTPLTGKAERYLVERMAESPRSQNFDHRGNKYMAHFLDLPERTLPVLEDLGRRLVGMLDEELDSDDRKTRERAKRSRPAVLRGLDDVRETMQARGLEPLTNAAAGAPQDGETDGERVRDDGPPALGDVPAQGAGPDVGPGGVFPGSGGGGAGADRGADAGADGRSDAGDGPRAARGQAQGSAADGPGASTEGDRAGGAGGGEPGRGAAPVATRFRPSSQDDLAPAGERAKAHANLAAVRTLKQVQAEERPAIPDEQQVLARWSGWGSVPDVFAARPQQDDPVFGPGGEREGGYAAAAARWEALADVRDPLRELLDDAEWRAAAASTLSAHYTPPEITAALWQALADLGFDGGEVLEPGSGAGVTFGTAPDSARLTGVEIDPTSAAISRLLAPGVTVLNESFADTIVPDGAFDAVVGNVPFARVTLFDPKHNRSRHRIHNHFLVKSVQLTRPGGVVALITSRHTMDAERDAARRELFESADLLGAVRLPNKAFARSAGTDVVTDILILRRRAEDETPGDASWVTSTRQDLDGHTLPVSDYFTAHPEHVLGTLTSRMGAHGPEVAVDGDPDVAVALNTALRQVTDTAVLNRRWYKPHPEGPHRPPLRLRPAASVTDFTGRLSADADGKLWQANSNSDPVAIDLPEAEHAQLTALIELKDLVRGLNDLDRRGTDAALADAQRRQTKAAYQRYVNEYGALTRPRQQQNATVKTDDGEERKRLTGYGYFLNDPSAYEVLALEWWEADTETVHVSQILERAPATRRSVLGQHTDDPQQALTAVVAERGHVDLDHIAWMLQVEPAEARRLLARSVFTDPLTGDLIHSPDYLSGDVRTKLAIAKQAARRDRAYETNVAELERVQPRELLPGQFAIRLGAAWIPDDMVQEFFRGYLGDAHLTIQHSGGGNWHVLKGRNLAEEDELRHSAGGLGPLAMVAKVLNGGAMTGRPADDEEAARAVRVKADEFRDAFEAWALDDSLRAARIAEVYNARMNARAVRDFTGSAPSLAGLDPDFTPYDHQLAAAARMAHERCLVLAHEVGAGKTATMTIGMMAMRNTGQINKPMVTVPNYLVEQWESTVRGLFPTARILALTSADLEDGKRDRMLEYIRANDFDLIITSHSLFDSIPLSPEFHEVYNNDEARLLREQITRERKRDGKSVSLKQLEERAAQFEEELKARAAAVRTPGQVYLDDLGVDFFAVDEFHEYKNLAVRSKIPGARVAGSGKAQHLHAVLEWARLNKPTGPIGVLATGTPLSNAIGELHTVVRMANPDLLRDIDAETFDAWASMYGRLVERMEMTTDGKGFKSVERFASFHNVSGLVRQLWHPLVDFKSAAELGLDLPAIKGGEPELMLVPATADQLQRMQELGERYEAFHEGGVDKSIDNPLAINNDARVIAMDSRLIDADAEPGNKLVALADRIIAKYEETKDNRYTYSATDQRPHPVPGALIGVFLNNGTPGGNNRGNFNAYQELKDLLVARGMPAEKVAFIHDAERADQRLKLSHQANHGGINVLVGSTMRMGKGGNWQNRMVSLFHVDPDWRPSDMAQRDGRIVRNGNQNEEVEIVWMATEGTFDSRMYGLLATKAKGFNQLYKARVDATNDEIMEVEDANLPYEEAMAIISGNPYLIEQEELRKQLRTLDLDQRNRATQRAILGTRLNELRIDIENLSYDIPRRARALPLLEPVLGDDFHITLAGAQYTKHKDAAGPLMQLLTGVGQSLPDGRATTPDARLGRLGGLDLVAVAYREDDGSVVVRLHLDGLPGIVQRSTLAELAELKGETVLRRLVKTLTDAPERQTEDEGNLAAKRTTRDQLLIDRERLRGPVPSLGRVRERKSLVDSLVAAQATLNKISKPSSDEPASVTTSRREATARRDDLQQRLDRLAAEPAAEDFSEAGAVLRDMDEAGPRKDPATYSPVQREAEAALLRAHLIVHGYDAEVSLRLSALGDTEQPQLGLTPPERVPAPAPAMGPQPAPEHLHIGSPKTAEEASPRGDGAPVDEQTEQQLPDPETQAAEPAPAPPPAADDSGTTEDAPEPDADPYGTANLFDEFGLARPERVPAPQDDPAPEEPEEEPESVPEGQMTVDEAQPIPAEPAPSDDQRERLTSADGQLAFTLLRVPTEDVRPEIVEGYRRRRDELAAAVETRNAQNAQSSEERDQELAQWQRSYKASNGLEPWRPLPSLRLTRRPDGLGLQPAEYAIGSWVTWQDTETGAQVTGQVMSPGAGTDTFYVSTDRTGVTGEYHVLSRSGKKKTGYSYSINGATTDLRPADGPPEPLPFESLPAVDAVPARPLASYADYVPKDGMAPVREPVPVIVGADEVRSQPAEVVFPVTADHIPFVVKVDHHDASATLLYTLRVEVDGEIVVKLWREETRAAAIDAAVRAARQARELADKPLYARSRNHTLDVAEDGVCAKCHRQFDGDTEAQPLYRVDGGDPTCAPHIASALDVSVGEVKELGTARRIMATRTVPEPQTDIEPAPAEEPVVPEAAAPAPDEPRLVDRAAVAPGDLVTITLDGPGVAHLDREIPGAVSVTGSVYPAYRDYHRGAVLLDSVIHDAEGNEMTSGADVTVQTMPDQVHIAPAGHREDLRPESRTVTQIRLGDLIAEGGTRGETVTEVRYAHNPLGATGFATRDVAKGTANGFSLRNTDQVLVVPRERRLPADYAEVFGRHHSHAEAVAQTRHTHERYAALREAAARQWPDGSGPQTELQTLRDAIQAVDADGPGTDAYRSNAAAMETAAAAATALFEAADTAALYNGHLGEPLHELRQHLDIQVHRLQADITHLEQREEERAAVAEPSAGLSSQDQLTARHKDKEVAATKPSSPALTPGEEPEFLFDLPASPGQDAGATHAPTTAAGRPAQEDAAATQTQSPAASNETTTATPEAPQQQTAEAPSSEAPQEEPKAAELPDAARPGDEPVDAEVAQSASKPAAPSQGPGTESRDAADPGMLEAAGVSNTAAADTGEGPAVAQPDAVPDVEQAAVDVPRPHFEAHARVYHDGQRHTVEAMSEDGRTVHTFAGAVLPAHEVTAEEDMPPVTSRTLAPSRPGASGWWEYSYQGRTYTATNLPDELMRGSRATLNGIIIDESGELVGRTFGRPFDSSIIWYHTHPGVPEPMVARLHTRGSALPEYREEERAYMLAGPPAEQTALDVSAGAAQEPGALTVAVDQGGVNTGAEEVEDQIEPEYERLYPEELGQSTAPAALVHEPSAEPDPPAAAPAGQQQVAPDYDSAANRPRTGADPGSSAPDSASPADPADGAPGQSPDAGVDRMEGTPAMTTPAADVKEASEPAGTPRWRREKPIDSPVTHHGQPFVLVQAGPPGGDPDQTLVTFPDGQVLATLRVTSAGTWNASMADERTPEAESAEAAVADVLGLWAVDAGQPLAPVHPYRARGDAAVPMVMAAEVRQVVQDNQQRITAAASRAWPGQAESAEQQHFNTLASGILAPERPAATPSDALELALRLHLLKDSAASWRASLSGEPRALLGFSLARMAGQIEHLRARIRSTVEESGVEPVNDQLDAAESHVADPVPRSERQLETPVPAGDQEANPPPQDTVDSTSDSLAAEPPLEESEARPQQLTTTGSENMEGTTMATPAPATDPEQASATRPAPELAPLRPELPLWAGNDLPTGKWERRGDVLHDYFDGRPMWQLKPGTVAQQPPVPPSVAAAEPKPAEVPADGDLWAGFEEVMEAWQEHVPADLSTPEDAWAAVQGDLRTLRQELQAEGASPAEPARPAAAAPARKAEPEAAAEAVNAALDKVDQHTTTGLRDSTEWQRLQTIRGAARHLWDMLKEKAGAFWNSLREDTRFQGFWKTVSIRVCEKIAELATAGAEKIRRSTAGDLPTADALMALSDTSLAYSTAARASTPQALPKAQADVQQAAEAEQVKADTGVQQPPAQAQSAPAEPQKAPPAKGPAGPLPYASKDEAVQASTEVVQHFRTWVESPMGKELVASKHPRLIAFKNAWESLPPAELPTGPGPATVPYGEVSKTARALWRKAAESGRFADADLKTLRAIADSAGAHSKRLAKTATGGGAGAAAPSRRAAVTTPGAAQQAPPRPRAAATMPNAGARPPGMSA